MAPSSSWRRQAMIFSPQPTRAGHGWIKPKALACSAPWVGLPSPVQRTEPKLWRRPNMGVDSGRLDLHLRPFGRVRGCSAPYPIIGRPSLPRRMEPNWWRRFSAVRFIPPAIQARTGRARLRDELAGGRLLGGWHQLVAAVNNGQLYTSTDSGTNWIAGDTARAWQAVACSADGTKLFAADYGSVIYICGRRHRADVEHQKPWQQRGGLLAVSFDGLDVAPKYQFDVRRLVV